MSSRGVDIPPELFEDVIWYVCDRPAWECPLSREQKHDISQCGQVCRYWAESCRVKLFSWISLRSAEDFHTFLSMLLSAPLDAVSPIHSLVSYIRADPDGKELPWLHQLPSLLALCEIDAVEVDGSRIRTASGKPLFRTLHLALPRSLPPSYTVVHKLCLTDVHFTDTTELSKLLVSCRELHEICLENLAWDTELTLESFMSLGFAEPLIRAEITTQQSFFAFGFIPTVIARIKLTSTRGPRKAEFLADREGYMALLNFIDVVHPRSNEPQPAHWAIERAHQIKGFRTGREYPAL